jgi:hypothetical protein
VIRRSLLGAVLVCSCALVAPSRAPAVSGLASPGPAAGAQYPGAEAQLPDLRRREVAARPAPTLLALGAGSRTARRRAALADERSGTAARARRAAASGPGGGVHREATVAVLLAGVALLTAGQHGRSRGVPARG